MNAIEMIARCMRLSEPSSSGDLGQTYWTKDDLEWLATKVMDKPLPVEEMGDPEAKR